MRKPIIGITAGEIVNNEYPWEPVTHGQRHTYIDAVLRAGGVPVTVPLTTDPDAMNSLLSRIDGLILSGGNDVSPSLYGEEQYDTKWYISKRRDDSDRLALESAMQNGLPILAICRGMHFLNVYNGGSLYQDIATDLPGTLNHVASVESQNFEEDAHKIELEEDSKLYEILQQKVIGTNSLHRQAIKKLGKGLRITSRTSDGVIESVETEDGRFIIGVQSHPESLYRVIPEWDKLFEAFVENALEKSNALVLK